MIYKTIGDPYIYKVINNVWYTKGKLILNWQSLENNIKAINILDSRFPNARNKKNLLKELNKMIRGKVLYAEDKMPAVNVAIFVSKEGIPLKMVKNGLEIFLQTTTDKLGNFELPARNNEEVTFQLVGTKKQSYISQNVPKIVYLESDNKIDEIEIVTNAIKKPINWVLIGSLLILLLLLLKKRKK